MQTHPLILFLEPDMHTPIHADRLTTPSAALRLACTATLVAAALLGTAHAQSATTDSAELQAQRLDQRQERQDSRIDQGVASGELTRREAHRLNLEQRHINRMERRAEADGDVTRREALRLEKAQDHASRHIGHAAHDRQSRPQ
jgi:hypothetical protein